MMGEDRTGQHLQHRQRPGPGCATSGAYLQCQVLKGLGWADLAVLVVLGLCRAGGLDM